MCYSTTIPLSSSQDWSRFVNSQFKYPEEMYVLDLETLWLKEGVVEGRRTTRFTQLAVLRRRPRQLLLNVMVDPLRGVQTPNAKALIRALEDINHVPQLSVLCWSKVLYKRGMVKPEHLDLPGVQSLVRDLDLRRGRWAGEGGERGGRSSEPPSRKRWRKKRQISHLMTSLESLWTSI